MDSATCIPDRRVSGVRKAQAFTLIELLVVIAIIVVLAGLVVGLARVAGESKKLSRARAERDKLVTLIENYRARLGVLPPDNTNNPGLNTLYYELGSAFRSVGPAPLPGSPGNPNYFVPLLGVNVSSNDLYSAFRAQGLINARSQGEDITELKPILKGVKPDQTNSLAPGTVSLTIPIDGPAGKNQPNPWRYLAGDNAVHNKESFDLWVELVIGDKKIIVGNWKD